jgi:hypothetical protein
VSDWWARGKEPLLQNEAEVDTEDLAASSVETDKIAALNVTSEKLSVTALRRSVVAHSPALAQETAQSSDFEIWRPSLKAILVGARFIPQAAWSLTTVQTTPLLTLFAGDDEVVTYNVDREDPPAAGVSVSLGTVDAAVDAGTGITFRIANTSASSGTVVPAHAVQLDWDSSA